MATKHDKEQKLMEASGEPITRERLQGDFAKLGIKPGTCLMLHSSLKSVGWLPGGVQLFIEALLEHLGPEGTLMVPTHSTQLTDPATWQAPPAPKAWHETIRSGFPAYDPDKTPTRSMGIIPETLRHWPGAVRSGHPHTSFCAVGRLAEKLTDAHLLNSPMGRDSPLQKLVDEDGMTLLLGVGFANNTCFHLAEDYLDNPPRFIDGAPLRIDGETVWTSFDAIDYDDVGFVECGARFMETGNVQTGKIGNADSLLFRTQSSVSFAKTWLRQNR